MKGLILTFLIFTGTGANGACLPIHSLGAGFRNLTIKLEKPRLSRMEFCMEYAILGREVQRLDFLSCRESEEIQESLLDWIWNVSLDEYCSSRKSKRLKRREIKALKTIVAKKRAELIEMGAIKERL